MEIMCSSVMKNEKYYKLATSECCYFSHRHYITLHYNWLEFLTQWSVRDFSHSGGVREKYGWRNDMWIDK